MIFNRKKKKELLEEAEQLKTSPDIHINTEEDDICPNCNCEMRIGKKHALHIELYDNKDCMHVIKDISIEGINSLVCMTIAIKHSIMEAIEKAEEQGIDPRVLMKTIRYTEKAAVARQEGLEMPDLNDIDDIDELMDYAKHNCSVCDNEECPARGMFRESDDDNEDSKEKTRRYIH